MAPFFPESLIRMEQRPQGPLRWVDGLAETMHEAYRQALLPGELGLEWARMGRAVVLE